MGLIGVVKSRRFRIGFRELDCKQPNNVENELSVIDPYVNTRLQGEKKIRKNKIGY